MFQIGLNPQLPLSQGEAFLFIDIFIFRLSIKSIKSFESYSLPWSEWIIAGGDLFSPSLAKALNYR